MIDNQPKRSISFPFHTLDEALEFPGEFAIDLDEGFTWAFTLRIHPGFAIGDRVLLDIGETGGAEHRFQLRLDRNGCLVFSVAGFAISVPKATADGLFGKWTRLSLVAGLLGESLHLKLHIGPALLWPRIFGLPASTTIHGRCCIGASVQGQSRSAVTVNDIAIWNRMQPMAKLQAMAEQSESLAAFFQTERPRDQNIFRLHGA